MSDIKCPNCGIWQEVNHDDGYGYEEDERHQQSCSSCEYEFEFTTSVMYSYSAYCQDGDHDMEQPLDDSPDFFTCKKCEYSELKRQ